MTATNGHSVECETQPGGTPGRLGATSGRLPSNHPAGGGRGTRVASGLMPPRSHQEVIWPDYMPSREAGRGSRTRGVQVPKDSNNVRLIGCRAESKNPEMIMIKFHPERL